MWKQHIFILQKGMILTHDNLFLKIDLNAGLAVYNLVFSSPIFINVIFPLFKIQLYFSHWVWLLESEL